MQNYMEGLRVWLLAFFTFLLGVSNAQLEDPTNWSTSVEQLSDDTFLLTTSVAIEEGYHMYSQKAYSSDMAPLPTEFVFYGAQGNYELVGPNLEVGMETEYVNVWEMDVYQFSGTATFKQQVRLLDPDLAYIAAEATSMVCDDERCLAPTPHPLLFNLKDNIVADAQTVVDSLYNAEASAIIAVYGSTDDVAKVPAEETTIKQQASLKSSKDEEKNDLWGIFLACLGAGLLALATPCVFPMIPMTVSFFTKQSRGGVGMGMLYGLCIVIIYALISVPFYLFESLSPDVINEFSTNPVLNIVFFVIFVVFAISFFGAFEITIPNSIINKVDNASNVGGIIGIFFMALTLALVSFSCTGPVLGGVLGGILNTDGGAVALTVGLTGFGVGLGLPFVFFAAFPGYLDKLPKSGGWLNTVKVFLGFIELALAFKFLSNADLVTQAHILEREVFLAIWIAIFLATSLYLLGKLRLPHDSEGDRISVGRLLVALFMLCFTVYLIPGLWGAPLKIISGFPPPLNYSESPYGVGYTKLEMNQKIPQGAELGVHDIVTFHSLEEGLAHAKEVNKPPLIDFTGWACVNCRKMEERVWGEPEVLDILKNEVVLISLYVDEKKTLPEEERYQSETSGRQVRTVGNKWSDLQIDLYQVNAQPYYGFLNLDGKPLEGYPAIGYTPDVDEYVEWLEGGITAFNTFK